MEKVRETFINRIYSRTASACRTTSSSLLRNESFERERDELPELHSLEGKTFSM